MFTELGNLNQLNESPSVNLSTTDLLTCDSNRALVEEASANHFRILQEISFSPAEMQDQLLNQQFPTCAELKACGILPINISDFDGTLVKDASGDAVISYAVKEGFFLPEIREKLNQMLAEYGLTPQTKAASMPDLGVNSDILRVKSAYQAWLGINDISPEERASQTSSFYQMCTWIFAGHTEAEVAAFTQRVLKETLFGSNYFAGAKELLETLLARGVETHIVSATFEPVVRIAAAYFGIPAEHVVGMRLKQDSEGRFTTRMKAPVTFRAGKAEAAQILMQRFQLEHPEWRMSRATRPLFAMGDSPSKTDEQLLALANFPIVAEPQSEGDARVAARLWEDGRQLKIIDYAQTIGGELAQRFDRTRAEPSSTVVDYL